LTRMPQLIRRAMPVEPAVTAAAAIPAAGPEDRIKAPINDVIRSRLRPPIQAQSPLQAAVSRRGPPVRRRGPQPLVATRMPVQPAQAQPPQAQSTQARIALPPEPPVTSGAMPHGAAGQDAPTQDWQDGHWQDGEAAAQDWQDDDPALTDTQDHAPV